MRYIPASLVFGLCLGLIVIAVLNFAKLVRPPDAVFEVPGSYRFHAAAVGGYTIWHQTSGVVDVEFRVAKAALPEGMRIRVTRSGQQVPITADTSTSSSTMGSERRSVLRFTATEPGDYDIVTTGFEEPLSFAITHGSFFRPFLIFFISVALAIMGVFPRRTNSTR